MLTLSELDGQQLLSVHEDKQPQLEIENYSGIKLFFAQCENLERTVINDCEHFNWICSIDNEKRTYYTLPRASYKFPEIATQVYDYYMVIASDPEGNFTINNFDVYNNDLQAILKVFNGQIHST